MIRNSFNGEKLDRAKRIIEDNLRKTVDGKKWNWKTFQELTALRELRSSDLTTLTEAFISTFLTDATRTEDSDGNVCCDGLWFENQLRYIQTKGHFTDASDSLRLLDNSRMESTDTGLALGKFELSFCDLFEILVQAKSKIINRVLSLPCESGELSNRYFLGCCLRTIGEQKTLICTTSREQIAGTNIIPRSL